MIDAFHVVNRAPIPERFFVDERKTRDGTVITDELLKLKETVQFENLPLEGRRDLRLVETPWELDLHPAL